MADTAARPSVVPPYVYGMRTLLRSVTIGIITAALLAVSFTARADAQTSYAICAISTSSTTSCLGVGNVAPTLLIGFFNGSGVIQSVTPVCTDGVNTFTIGPLGGTQIVLFPAPGFPLAGRLSCIPGGTPIGTIYLMVH